MKCHNNINFPEISFTSPGTYSYTIKELTPSDKCWITDDRVYRAVVTVTEGKDGTLKASVDYPDGFPKFVNTYNQEPPIDVCKYFRKLPFPMFLFYPPQKEEFLELMKTHPNIFDWWEDVIKTHRKFANNLCNTAHNSLKKSGKTYDNTIE